MYSTPFLRTTETLRCRKEKAFLHSEPALRGARDLTLHTVAHVLIFSVIMPDLSAFVYQMVFAILGHMATTWWTLESSICAILCRHVLRSKVHFGDVLVSLPVTLPHDHASPPDFATVPDQFVNTSTYLNILQPTNIVHQFALVASRVDKVTSSGIPSSAMTVLNESPFPGFRVSCAKDWTGRPS